MKNIIQREIPFEWQLIVCSFEAVGIIPLLLCYKWTRQLRYIQNNK